MGRKDADRRLDELATLKDGWYSEGPGRPARAPTPKAVEIVRKLIHLSNGNIFPKQDGGFLLEWFGTGPQLMIDVNHDGTVEGEFVGDEE